VVGAFGVQPGGKRTVAAHRAHVALTAVLGKVNIYQCDDVTGSRKFLSFLRLNQPRHGAVFSCCYLLGGSPQDFFALKVQLLLRLRAVKGLDFYENSC
jgi:hypothetical protein